jgi:hypothetical protein
LNPLTASTGSPRLLLSRRSSFPIGRPSLRGRCEVQPALLLGQADLCLLACPTGFKLGPLLEDSGHAGCLHNLLLRLLLL